MLAWLSSPSTSPKTSPKKALCRRGSGRGFWRQHVLACLSLQRRSLVWLLAISVISLAISASLFSFWGPGSLRTGQHKHLPKDEFLQHDGGHKKSLTNLSSQYVVLLCDRGQFSNRMYCLKRGLVIAQALNRTLVLPVLTDSKRHVNISQYYDMSCFREQQLASTFLDFQQSVCSSAGLMPAPAGSGHFCSGDHTLHLPHTHSLTDRSHSTTCASRSLGLHSATQLGMKVHGCEEVPPNNGPKCKSCKYELQPFLQKFGDDPHKVLVFADMFGVNLFESLEDRAAIVASPSQMCTFLPAPRLVAAAQWLSQILLTPPTASKGRHGLMMSLRALGEVPGVPGSGDAGTLAPESVGSFPGGGSGSFAGTERVTRGTEGASESAVPGSQVGSGISSNGNWVQQQAAVGAASQQLQQQEGASRSLREGKGHVPRGSYLAIHLRRGDWFYFCSGKKRCFYSLAEISRCLAAEMQRKGVAVLYASTNADPRDKEMLREGIPGKVVFWEDVLQALEGADSGPALAVDMSDPQDAAMLEKTLCVVASGFVSTPGSTFSDQIIEFRNLGLTGMELDVLSNKFKVKHHSYSREEYATCAKEPPTPDFREFLEPYNANLALATVLEAIGSLPAPATPSYIPQTLLKPKPIPWYLRPTYLFTQLAHSIWDLNLMGAANRFVSMYMSPAFVTVDFTSVQEGDVDRLLGCLNKRVKEVGVDVLFLVTEGLRVDVAVWLERRVREEVDVRHVLRIGGERGVQEGEMEWTKLYEASGISRHSEGALLGGVDGAMPQMQRLIGAKSAAFLWEGTSVFSKEVTAYRGVFGFESTLDGPVCRGD